MNLKIVVTGAFSSGKSKFCESLATDWQKIDLNPEMRGTWRYGTFQIDEETSLEIHEAPQGSRRFDFMWEIFSEDMIGFIALVDSNDPRIFREAKSVFETFRAYCPTPFVIAATKQDLEGAWSIEDLRIVLRIPPEIPIVPCVATDKKSVANVLLALCEEVLRDVDTEVEA